MKTEEQLSIEAVRDIAERIESSLEALRATRVRWELVMHAISIEANRGFKNKIGKREIQRVIDSLDNLKSLLFEDDADGE